MDFTKEIELHHSELTVQRSSSGTVATWPVCGRNKAFEGPHGGLLFCFRLIRIDPWFVTYDDLWNVFQHFFTPIDKHLFLSDCQIVRDPTRINLFYGQVFMQYWMYAVGGNAQECFYLTVCHMHQCSLTQRLFLQDLHGPRLLANVVHNWIH